MSKTDLSKWLLLKVEQFGDMLAHGENLTSFSSEEEPNCEQLEYYQRRLKEREVLVLLQVHKIYKLGTKTITALEEIPR